MNRQRIPQNSQPPMLYLASSLSQYDVKMTRESVKNKITASFNISLLFSLYISIGSESAVHKKKKRLSKIRIITIVSPK